jgi:hypothetical protein
LVGEEGDDEKAVTWSVCGGDGMKDIEGSGLGGERFSMVDVIGTGSEEGENSFSERF